MNKNLLHQHSRLHLLPRVTQPGDAGRCTASIPKVKYKSHTVRTPVVRKIGCIILRPGYLRPAPKIDA